MRRTYKFRAYPKGDTESNAMHWLSLCQQLYNCALEQRIDTYARFRKSLSAYDQMKELKHLKVDFPEYKEVGSQVLKDVMTRLDLAYKAFFRRVKAGAGKQAGFPRFQGRHFYNSFTFPNSSGWKFDGKYFDIKYVGRFRLKGLREMLGTICTVTVKKEPSGKWFVLFSCKDIPTKDLPKTGKDIAIDVGTQSFVSDSEGQQVVNPKFSEAIQRRLRVLQRSLSRKQRGSKRREQVRVEIARLHEKVVNRRNDFAWKLASSYTEQYDRIAITTVPPIPSVLRGGVDAKIAAINSSLYDAARGNFAHKLHVKAEERSRDVIEVDYAYVQRTCSQCGAVKDIRPDVTFLCHECGAKTRRSYNSALNIRDRAFGEAQSTINPQTPNKRRIPRTAQSVRNTLKESIAE